MFHRRNRTFSASMLGDVTVRVAGPDDARALARLAALDSAALPVGPALVAEIDGDLAAALPMHGGAAIADPFRRTAALLELLELRARQLRLAASAPETTSEAGRLGRAGRHARPMPQLP